jgi:hypothetical protein
MVSTLTLQCFLFGGEVNITAPLVPRRHSAKAYDAGQLRVIVGHHEEEARNPYHRSVCEEVKTGVERLLGHRVALPLSTVII